MSDAGGGWIGPPDGGGSCVERDSFMSQKIRRGRVERMRDEKHLSNAIGLAGFEPTTF